MKEVDKTGLKTGLAIIKDGCKITSNELTKIVKAVWQNFLDKWRHSVRKKPLSWVCIPAFVLLIILLCGLSVNFMHFRYKEETMSHKIDSLAEKAKYYQEINKYD